MLLGFLLFGHVKTVSRETTKESRGFVPHPLRLLRRLLGTSITSFLGDGGSIIPSASPRIAFGKGLPLGDSFLVTSRETLILPRLRLNPSSSFAFDLQSLRVLLAKQAWLRRTLRSLRSTAWSQRA